MDYLQRKHAECATEAIYVYREVLETRGSFHWSKEIEAGDDCFWTRSIKIQVLAIKFDLLGTISIRNNERCANLPCSTRLESSTVISRNMHVNWLITERKKVSISMLVRRHSRISVYLKRVQLSAESSWREVYTILGRTDEWRTWGFERTVE